VNVPRTLPEFIANVLAGEELELERKGKEVDLEGRGENGKGTGREGERALPSPPSGGGGAVASPQNYGGDSKPTPSGKEGMDCREAAITNAIVRLDRKEWTVPQAVERLVTHHGLTPKEAHAALGATVGAA
jgi:hypothetical protein